MSPTVTTTYYLTEKITATGCTKSDSVIINVNLLPAAVTGSNTAICFGGSLSIGDTAISGNTYSWTSNPAGFSDTTSEPSVSPTVTTTYYLTEKITVTGCNKSDSVVITVNALPAANAGSNGAICFGQNTFIGNSSVSGDTYTWTSNPAGFSDTTSNPSVSPTVTTTYYLTEKVTATGCSKSDSVVITVNPLPAANAGSSGAICFGKSTSIGATGVSGNTYLWISNPSGFMDTSANPIVSPTVTTTYYLADLITATGCNKADSVIIIVNPLPAAKTGNNTAICKGTSITLGDTAVSGHTYTWSSNPAGFVDTTANPTVFPGATITYYLTETVTSSGCSKSDSVVITVNPLPAANTGTNSAVCFGSSTIIGAAAVSGDTYSWISNPVGFSDTTSNPTVSPVIQTTYYLNEKITATGCSKSDSIVIIVNPIPTAKTGNNSTICAGTNTLIGAAAISGNTYSWASNPIGLTDTTSNPSVSPMVTTTYYLTESITATGCKKSDSVIITANPLPSANVGSNNIVCIGSGITIGGASVTGNTYTWTSMPTGFTDSVSGPMVSPTITTTYYLTEKITATGCSKSDSLVVTVSPIPVASIKGGSNACANSAATYTTPSVANTNYTWIATGGSIISGQGTDSVIVNWGTAKGVISLILQNTGNCRDSVADSITILAVPVSSISGPATVCSNNTNMYSAAYTPGNGYTWVVSGGIIVSGQNKDTVSVIWNNAGSYNISVQETNASNCSDSASQAVAVNATPAQPVISQGSGDTLVATPDTAAGYQWYLNDNAIPGATQSKLLASVSGIYTVVATNGSCSSDSATAFNFTGIGGDNIITYFSIYPNPAKSTLNINATFARPTTLVVELLNTLGQTIIQLDPQRVKSGEYNNSIYVGELAKGMYYLKVTTGSSQVVQRILKD